MNSPVDRKIPRQVLMALVLIFLVSAAGLVSLKSVVEAQSEEIHRERSQYSEIIVTEQDGRRCMRFDVRRHGNLNQSCYLLNDPDRLVFDYTQMSFAGLLVNPQPERILVAGLGGGSIPTVMNELFPQAHIDVVELDPAVIRVAEEYFGFESNGNIHAHAADARVFIKRAGLRGERYDYVVLDAFGGEYIPEHLMTREFLQEVKQVMSDDAVLVANTFSSSELYDHESVTYRDVFGTFFNFRRAGTGNRIIVATSGPLPSRGDLRQPARDLHERLADYGVTLLEYPSRMSTRTDWNTEARVLTDQYSPVNLLD
ncbi:MAG: fused MFS/spermidine synthase [Pseudohongiellaceae bacterium]